MSPRRLNVHLLPDQVPPHQLAGKTVVVVDVLRATTTAVYALAAGVRQIMPCLEVAEAREMARRLQQFGEAVLLGGERGGLPIAGFDLGNSPQEYQFDRVGGRLLVFTTTNGTRALMRCVGADRVLLGAFANWQAVWRSVQSAQELEIVCAGTEGEVSWEDTLFAGSVASAWCDAGGDHPDALNDAARLARAAWRAAVGEVENTPRLSEALRQGKGGQNLLAIGKGPDIERVAQSNQWEIVPELHQSDWWIRPFPVH